MMLLTAGVAYLPAMQVVRELARRQQSTNSDNCTVLQRLAFSCTAEYERSYEPQINHPMSPANCSNFIPDHISVIGKPRMAR